MYRHGHYGVSLLVYAPIAYTLVQFGEPGFAVLGGVLTLALTPVPDYDHRLPFVTHRGVTHTILFAVLVGSVLAATGWLIGTAVDTATGLRLATFGFCVGTFAIGAHLLADVITPAGITPFWPLSRRKYTLGLTRANNTVANYALLAAGVFATVTVVILVEPAIVSILMLPVVRS